MVIVGLDPFASRACDIGPVDGGTHTSLVTMHAIAFQQRLSCEGNDSAPGCKAVELGNLRLRDMYRGIDPSRSSEGRCPVLSVSWNASNNTWGGMITA
eukprot:538054-Rhodomonas_salina.1